MSIRNLEFSAPIKIVSEANQRGHWGLKNKRRVAQQQAITVYMLKAKKRQPIELPCVVTLTRIGPKPLDDDNLINAFKVCRDSIANLLGVDDGDTSKVRFTYWQKPTGKREYSINVKIESAE